MKHLSLGGYKKIMVLIAVVLAFNTIYGQKQLSLRVNAGIASGAGFVAGLNGFDGEAELLAGVQFGIKF